MESAFRTVLSALGVVAACYILTAATWTQVLLLFLAACLGWCVFSTFAGRLPKRPASAMTRKLRDRFLAEPAVESPRLPEPPKPQAPLPAVYRFPIHQLSQ
jgi:hypothetical protein